MIIIAGVVLGQDWGRDEVARVSRPAVWGLYLSTSAEISTAFASRYRDNGCHLIRVYLKLVW